MTENNESQSSTSPTDFSGKFLTFILSEGDYAVRILQVREIIAMHEITPLPRVPEFVRGVINLRGKIIPVVDLRMRLDLEAKEYDRSTCIVVMDVETPNGAPRNIGCIVNTVSEVVDVKEEDVQSPPSLGKRVRTDYIMGLLKQEDRVVTILDMQNVLASLDPASIGLEPLEVEA